MKGLTAGFLVALLALTQANHQSPIFKKIGSYEFTDPSTQNTYVSTYYDSQNLKLLWNDAFVFCKAFGMELAMFETKEEQDYVLDMLQKDWKQNFERETFIGGTRIGSNDLSDWYWAATGRKINYPLRWNRGQPDNYQGVEHCLTIMNVNQDKFTINDAECSTTKVLPVLKFICEKNEIKEDYCTKVCIVKRA